MKTFWNSPSKLRGHTGKSASLSRKKRRLRVEPLENRMLMAAAVFDWAFNIGSAEGQDQSYDTATDSEGNAYIAGWFNATMDFDPAPPDADGPHEFKLTSNGSHDTFVAKYSPTGKFIWAVQMGDNTSGTNNDYAWSLAVDGNGDVLVTGNFLDAGQFGGVSLTSNGSADAYVAKIRGQTGSCCGPKVWAPRAGIWEDPLRWT